MTIESFCKVVWNLSYDQVSSSITKKDYIQFDIPKKNGVRTITLLPEGSSLYVLQRNFNKYYLNKQELSICVKGFVQGECYISYLEPHIGAKYFVRMDIKDFFPSVTSEIIKETFSHLLSFDTDGEKEKILELISEICTYKGTLPQGVPTSPVISNIVMARIDQRITKYCQILGITYTRYADDLLFSSDTFDFKSKKWFIKKIKHILASLRLVLNYSKLKFSENEISLNGYVISDSGIRLSRSRLMDIQKALAFSREHHNLSKTNQSEFLRLANQTTLEYRNLKVYPFNSVFQFVQFLIGYRSYLISFLKYDIDSTFRKKVGRLIRNIEYQVEFY